MNRTVVAGTCLGIVLCAASASAQELGEQGAVAVGADRIAGVYFTKLHTEASQTSGGVTAKAEIDDSITQIALLGHDPDAPQSVPRLSLDGFVTDGLSIGGSLVYLRQTGEQEAEYSSGGQSTSQDQDRPTESLFLIAPRIGYALPIGDGAFFWPRAGIVYGRLSQEDEEEDGATGDEYTETTTITFTDITLEANVVLSPVEHFGVLLGGFYDVPLGGDVKVEYDPSSFGPDNEPDTEVKLSGYGLQVGLLGWF